MATLKKSSRQDRRLTSIEITGFKSIAKKTKIDFASLTILSGANSSGKSSVSQSILLLKQTNEAAYDPGAILLNGPNVKLTSAKHLLSQLPGLVAEQFIIRFTFEKNSTELCYKYAPGKPGALDIEYIKEYPRDGSPVSLTYTSRSAQIMKALVVDIPEDMHDVYLNIIGDSSLKVTRDRCFFSVVANRKFGNKQVRNFETQFGLITNRRFLKELIHVPGLRGNPERTYATTATTSGNFPGRFEPYVASLVSNWEREDPEKFARLTKNLVDLGLTSQIKVQPIDDTQVEIKVSRLKNLPTENEFDHLVSIADVGFGVSQVLPILVALIVAEPGQYVIIEQPELHLHPKAQSKMAAVLAEAISKGVKVIIETHSNILLQGIQTLVAEKAIGSGDVALNWFETTSTGYTKVNSGGLDKIGAFGNWPADFMDVQLESEAAYLDAVEKAIYS